MLGPVRASVHSVTGPRRSAEACVPSSAGLGLSMTPVPATTTHSPTVRKLEVRRARSNLGVRLTARTSVRNSVVRAKQAATLAHIATRPVAGRVRSGMVLRPTVRTPALSSTARNRIATNGHGAR